MNSYFVKEKKQFTKKELFFSPDNVKPVVSTSAEMFPY